MKYERFEDLPVWKTAIDVATRTYSLTRDRFFAQPGDLCDQLRRAAISISNNIAEGFERGSTAELIAFLYIARGSAGEVRSMLNFIERDLGSEHLKFEISTLKSLVENCSRQVRGWADHLQNTEIKGQRHLTEQTRKHFQQKKDYDAFLRHLDEVTRRGRPDAFPADAIKSTQSNASPTHRDSKSKPSKAGLDVNSLGATARDSLARAESNSSKTETTPPEG